MNHIRVVYKYVTQYFNLNSYLADQTELVSNSQATVQVDLLASMSIAHKGALQQNTVQVFDNKFIDMSALPLISDTQEDIVFYEVINLASGLFEGETNDFDYGYLSVTMIQDNKLISS